MKEMRNYFKILKDLLGEKAKERRLHGKKKKRKKEGRNKKEKGKWPMSLRLLI